MKIILKNLKQVQYEIEIESDKKTVKDLKEEVEKVHGFDAAQIKLLHNGKVLEDAKTLEEYQIKDENVIIMMNTKPKQKSNPAPAEQPKTESEKKDENPKPKEEEPKANYTEQINSLVDMGYEREKVEKAINAAKGNIDIAIEFLHSGSIPDNVPRSEPSQPSAGSGLPLELKRNASIMKIVCHENPEKIFSILNNLKVKNPALLDKIKEHEEEFKQALVSPINQEDIAAFRQLEQDLQGLSGEGGRRVEIRLSPEEAEAVKRLKDLGNFSQAEVLQAYIACDKNEELAANYLFEQKFREDEANNNNNNNNNNNQGQ